jgi:hypothetical protein
MALRRRIVANEPKIITSDSVRKKENGNYLSSTMRWFYAQSIID